MNTIGIRNIQNMETLVLPEVLRIRTERGFEIRNLAGELLNKKFFNMVEVAGNNCLIVMLMEPRGKMGLVDSRGNELTEFIYNEITSSVDGIVCLEHEEGYYQIYNVNTKQLWVGGWTINNSIWTEDDLKWDEVKIDPCNKLVIGTKYLEEVDYTIRDFFTFDGELIARDADFCILNDDDDYAYCEMVYYKVHEFLNGFALVYSEETNKYGLINNKGEKVLPVEYDYLQIQAIIKSLLAPLVKEI